MIVRLLHLAAALVLAPLLPGVINRTKAFFGGRDGPPLLQPYYDIFKLLQKDAVYSKTTTWVFRAGPVAALAAAL
ncbi:MAG: NADH-quinone oxidoreductase subunit H, partial [Elusimicrobiota bacterium]